MTNEQQRIAIAEACGYKDVATGMTEGTVRVTTGFKHHTFDEEIPDYLNDLNAMYEAERVLERESGYHEIGGYGLYLVALEHNASATAAQRAEAFLRTIDKWEITEL